MSQFEATKCDECGRIQGEANHWIRMEVWSVPQGVIGLSLGEGMLGCMMGSSQLTSATSEIRDLCGQGCAVKHIAKLLGWNLPTES